MFAEGHQRGLAMMAAINLASGGQQGGGQPPQAAPQAAPPVSGDWLLYANQGSIRNDPLSDQLTSAMSFLPEMGIRMRVHSGGQEARGEGGNRTGSIRHDHGNAGDVEFVMSDGTVLDGTNPQHRPIITDIVRRARANGVEGWGWGTDYMGPTRFHLGFGTPAVWGANGRSANAADWWRAAYGAPGAGGPSPSGGGTPGNALALTGGGGSTGPVYGNAGSDTLGAPTTTAPMPGTPMAMQPPPQMDTNALALLLAAQQPQPPQMQSNALDARAFMAPQPQNALLPYSWGR